MWSQQLSWTSRNQAWERSRTSLRQQDQPLPLGLGGYRTARINAVQDSVRQLWKILRVMWQRWRVADQCRCPECIWIPKEENSKDTNPFRTMSLLSIEGNIFFSILSRQLSSFLVKNDCIDTSGTERQISGTGNWEQTGSYEKSKGRQGLPAGPEVGPWECLCP